MESIQSGILILYSSLLVAGTTNKYGTANANNTDLIFTNINLKEILGSNYYRYEKFNLILNSIVMPAALALPAPNDGNVLIYITGLPFDTGATYSTVSQKTTSISYIGSVRMLGATGGVITYPPTFFTTILKPQDTNDIIISLRGAIATLTTTGATFLLNPAYIYPQMVFTFSIVPVLETVITQFPSREDKTITYKQRLIK